MFGRPKKAEIKALRAVAGASSRLVQYWSETDEAGKYVLVRNVSWTLRVLEAEENAGADGKAWLKRKIEEERQRNGEKQ